MGGAARPTRKRPRRVALRAVVRQFFESPERFHAWSQAIEGWLQALEDRILRMFGAGCLVLSLAPLIHFCVYEKWSVLLINGGLLVIYLLTRAGRGGAKTVVPPEDAPARGRSRWWLRILVPVLLLLIPGLMKFNPRVADKVVPYVLDALPQEKDAVVPEVKSLPQQPNPSDQPPPEPVGSLNPPDDDASERKKFLNELAKPTPAVSKKKSPPSRKPQQKKPATSATPKPKPAAAKSPQNNRSTRGPGGWTPRHK